jgi:transposase
MQVQAGRQAELFVIQAGFARAPTRACSSDRGNPSSGLHRDASNDPQQRTQRWHRWAKKGAWERIFKALLENPDFEYLIIDSTIVRAHQHAAGAKGGAKMRRSGVRAAA